MKPDDFAPIAYRADRNARFEGMQERAPAIIGIYHAVLITGITLLAIVALIACWRLVA